MTGIERIASADAKERMRRFTFLVIVAIALYAAYLYLPGPHASYATISIDDHRGLYNAAYVGAAVTILTSLYLSLAGFFFVRGAIERDAILGVDDIVAATPVSRVRFLLGKWLSNVVTLLIVAAVTLVAAAVVQQWRGEDRTLDAAAYILPFVLVTIPAMAIVSAFAICFDAIKPLRGVLGGVIYVMIVWMNMLVIPLTHSNSFMAAAPIDPLGVTVIVSQLYDAATAEYPNEHNADIGVGGTPAPAHGFTIYRFHGFQVGIQLVFMQAMWLAISILLVVAASFAFDRFRREPRARSNRRWTINAGKGEFGLLVNGTSPWWIVGGAAIAVAAAVAPLNVALEYIAPIALIWPLERISSLGARERVDNVLDIFRATNGYAWANVLAQVGAGAALQMLLLAGLAVRLLTNGNAEAVLALALTSAAIAASALLLGTWSHLARTFQAIFLVLWYVGPVEHAPWVDVIVEAAKNPIPLIACCATIAIAAMAATTILRERWRHAA